MEETITQQEKNQNENEEIKEMGQLTLGQGTSRHKIHWISQNQRMRAVCMSCPLCLV